MKVYVESNFVLELALCQEQSDSCEKLLAFCQNSDAELILPAYCLAEPYETLKRRHGGRVALKKAIDQEMKQIRRTTEYSLRLEDFQNTTSLLIETTQVEELRLIEVQNQLMSKTRVIPLSMEILQTALNIRERANLAPQDSIVYATVLEDLKANKVKKACFINRNSKDFDDPIIVDELRNLNCKFIPRFDSHSAP